MSDLAGILLFDALHMARARNASDLHVQTGSAIAIRVDGELEFLGGAIVSDSDVASMTASFLGGEVVDRVMRGEDVSLSVAHADSGLLRVHAFSTSQAPALSVRFLSSGIPSFEDLALPQVLDTLTRRRNGLILFTGSTGSGKSTTLAAFIDRLNTTHAYRIITVEDPIEYRYANKRSLIAQREIGSDVSSFDAALRGALRADPDVIAIGEMRDRATILAALTAAETGHLVLATLHAADAAQTIDRVVDMFDGGRHVQVRSQLAQVLEAVVCQELVPRTSAPGRRAIVEVLIANDAVRNIIRDGRRHHLGDVIATGRSHGMQTFSQHRSELVASGTIRQNAGRS